VDIFHGPGTFYAEGKRARPNRKFGSQRIAYRNAANEEELLDLCGLTMLEPFAYRDWLHR